MKAKLEKLHQSGEKKLAADHQSSTSLISNLPPVEKIIENLEAISVEENIYESATENSNASNTISDQLDVSYDYSDDFIRNSQSTQSTDDPSLQQLKEKIQSLKEKTMNERLELKERKVKQTKVVVRDLLQKRNETVERKHKLKQELSRISKVLEKALKNDSTVISTEETISVSDPEPKLETSFQNAATLSEKQSSQIQDNSNITQKEISESIDVQEDLDTTIAEMTDEDIPSNSMIEEIETKISEEPSSVASEIQNGQSTQSHVVSSSSSTLQENILTDESSSKSSEISGQ
jgi:hypothetical protein